MLLVSCGVGWNQSLCYWRCPGVELRCVSGVWIKCPFLVPPSMVRFNFRPITASPCANTPAAANAYLLFSLTLLCVLLFVAPCLSPPPLILYYLGVWGIWSCVNPYCVSSCTSSVFTAVCKHVKLWRADMAQIFIVPAIPQLTKQINTFTVY